MEKKVVFKQSSLGSTHKICVRSNKATLNCLIFSLCRLWKFNGQVQTINFPMTRKKVPLWGLVFRFLLTGRSSKVLMNNLNISAGFTIMAHPIFCNYSLYFVIITLVAIVNSQTPRQSAEIETIKITTPRSIVQT